MLAKRGLRADRVAKLALDDIDWRASEILVRAKGPTVCTDPIPLEVHAAIAAYLRNACPKSSCRRLFARRAAPHVGFASGRAITTIAKPWISIALKSKVAHTGALTSFNKVSLPSFSDLA
ncbi:site-specific recombinase XerC [Bradyrhizobium sp. i1.4.4]